MLGSIVKHMSYPNANGVVRWPNPEAKRMGVDFEVRCGPCAVIYDVKRGDLVGFCSGDGSRFYRWVRVKSGRRRHHGYRAEISMPVERSAIPCRRSSGHGGPHLLDCSVEALNTAIERSARNEVVDLVFATEAES